MRTSTKYILFIFSLIILIGCTKEEKSYSLSYEELINKKFARTSTYVEFISSDSLVWMVDQRDTPVSYRVKYHLNGDKISFEVRDTTRVEYKDSNTGYTSFSKTYYYDSFEGVFKDVNTISATMNHSYEERVEDKYVGSHGTTKTSFDFYYTE